MIEISDSYSPLPNYTDTVQYYLDHRKLLQAEKKKGEDIELGRKIFQLIYAKAMLKDPMLAVLMFQQELLPVKQMVEDDSENILSHRMDMRTDLDSMVNMAESLFNKGAKITPEEADHLAYLLLFLTAIPFAKDIDQNGDVVKGVESAFNDLTTKVFSTGRVDRDTWDWGKRIYVDQRWLFNTADAGGGEHADYAMHAIKEAYDDINQATSLLTSSSKMLQNDAQNTANDEKVQLGGYTKMSEMQLSFERQSNRRIKT